MLTSRCVETLRPPEGQFSFSCFSSSLKCSHTVDTETCDLKSSSNSTSRQAKQHRAASSFLLPETRGEHQFRKRRHTFFTSEKSWCVCSHMCHMYNCPCPLNPQDSFSARNYIYLFDFFFYFFSQAAVIAALSTCSSGAPGNMEISAC